MSKKITIFTPTYNRAYCIHELYKSLKRQSCKDFEWIILDDGSTDNTNQLCEKWIREDNEFEIIYIKTRNNGKMTAINKGVKLSTTPLFFIVDSDDYLLDDTVKWILQSAKDILYDDSFAGLSGLRKIQSVEAKHNFNYIDATNLERRKYNLIMDMAECYKTDILRKYPAPEIEGESYLSPSIVWNSIALDGYKIRYYNKVIYIAEYRPDGLTMAGPEKFKKNPIGWAKLIQLNIKCKNDIEYSEFQYYLYYNEVKNNLSIDMICKYLEIPKNYLEQIVLQKPKMINLMNNYFRDNGIKKIALYGMGFEAKRFLQIAEDMDIDICYGIDRIPNSLLTPCYKPTDMLPDVDAILITNLRGSTKIKIDLEGYTQIKAFSLQEDILEKGFRYYFSDL